MASTVRPSEPEHPGSYVRKQVFPKGMSVTKAASLLEVGRPALSSFLNGRSALSQEMARKLERAFGVDREYLLDLQMQYNRRDEAIGTPVVAGRHAPTLVEISAHRIEQWADRTIAREDLPALLRRLVCSTGDRLIRIDFPAFDNSQRPGPDGEVETAAPTPWIPEGRSIWEFGCNRNPCSQGEGRLCEPCQFPVRKRTQRGNVRFRNATQLAGRERLGYRKDQPWGLEGCPRLRCERSRTMARAVRGDTDLVCRTARRSGQRLSVRSDMCWSDWAEAE